MTSTEIAGWLWAWDTLGSERAAHVFRNIGLPQKVASQPQFMVRLAQETRVQANEIDERSDFKSQFGAIIQRGLAAIESSYGQGARVQIERWVRLNFIVGPATHRLRLWEGCLKKLLKQQRPQGVSPKNWAWLRRRISRDLGDQALEKLKEGINAAFRAPPSEFERQAVLIQGTSEPPIDQGKWLTGVARQERSRNIVIAMQTRFTEQEFTSVSPGSIYHPNYVAAIDRWGLPWALE